MQCAAGVPSHTKNGADPSVTVTALDTGLEETFGDPPAAAIALDVSDSKIMRALRGYYQLPGHAIEYTQNRADLKARRDAADGEFARLRGEPVPRDIVPGELPLPYYAGLFEHRGMILPNNGRLTLTLAHKTEAVCMALLHRFGGVVQSLQNRGASSKERRVDFEWMQGESEEAVVALELMRPYLPSRVQDVTVALADVLVPPITTITQRQMREELKGGAMVFIDWRLACAKANPVVSTNLTTLHGFSSSTKGTVNTSVPGVHTQHGCTWSYVQNPFR